MRDSLLKSAFDANEFSIQESITITGREAQKAYRSKRRNSIEIQLNATYFINSFKWGDDYQSARVAVRRESDNFEFVATLAISALTDNQKEQFKTATFDHLRVYLQVDATMLDGAVTTAKILSVGLQP